MFKFLLITCSLLLVAQQVSGQQFCEKYFFSYPISATWTAAIQACRAIGDNWDLVSIQNTLKNNEINLFLNSKNANNITNMNIWTSGHRRGGQAEEQFVWVDHLAPVNFVVWDFGEPQVSVIDSNIAITLNSDNQYRWAALRNGPTSAFYICEKNSCASRV